MAGIILDAIKIERALKPLGCTKVSGVPAFKGKSVTPHEMWRTPWGHQFMVPQSCAHWVLADIIDKEVTDTKPADWKDQTH